MIPVWRIWLENLPQRFAAWRVTVWTRRATRALAKRDWWRGRAGGP